MADTTAEEGSELNPPSQSHHQQRVIQEIKVSCTSMNRFIFYLRGIFGMNRMCDSSAVSDPHSWNNCGILNALLPRCRPQFVGHVEVFHISSIFRLCQIILTVDKNIIFVLQRQRWVFAAMWLCCQTHLPSLEEVQFTDQVWKDKIIPATLLYPKTADQRQAHLSSTGLSKLYLL